MTDAVPVRPGAPLSRLERFAAVGSTNDIVRAWLAAGEAEVCVAVTDEQTAGRGRLGRTWTAPPGAALLLSAGFRPSWLPLEHVWRLPAVVALAMSDAAEDAAGLAVGTVRLKWPNDLVIEARGPHAPLAGVEDPGEAAARLAGPVALRKLGGVLGESDGLGTGDPRVVVGIGVNADWPGADFPPALADGMTSLREASGGRPVDRDALLDAFLRHLENRLDALRAGYFDLATWTERQALTGLLVRLEGYGGGERELLVAGVDGSLGSLLVRDPADADAEPWAVRSGEVVHVRPVVEAGV